MNRFIFINKLLVKPANFLNTWLMTNISITVHFLSCVKLIFEVKFYLLSHKLCIIKAATHFLRFKFSANI